MEQFLQQIASGLANGAIYACVALALVMIYVSTDHINFAQGEMAMFSTYISWQLMSWGLSFWFAFILAVVLSFVLGVVIERVILRPLHNAPVLSIVVVSSLLLACVFVLLVRDAAKLQRLAAALQRANEALANHLMVIDDQDPHQGSPPSRCVDRSIIAESICPSRVTIAAGYFPGSFTSGNLSNSML